ADSVVATRSRILMVRCAPLSRMMRERTHCRPFNFKQQSVHMVRDGAMRLLTMRVRVHLSSHETSSCEEAAGGRVSKDGTPGAARHSPRNGFNGLLRDLPGDRAFLSPSSCEYGWSAPGRGRLRLHKT